MSLCTDSPNTGLDNLLDWWNRSSSMDREYGETAYSDYRLDITSSCWPVRAEVTCAVFALLSPNNDYAGNVRCTEMVIQAFAQGKDARSIQGLTTYKACAERAYRVLEGHSPEVVFSKNAKKTYSFYHNILDPADPKYITIDGHMYNLWRGERSLLKDVAQRFRPKLYNTIAADFMELARITNLVPNQVQATLWWAYKRINRIRFDPQMDLELYAY